LVKSVEITTAHTFRIDYELASVSDKTIASIINLAILVGCFILLFIFKTKLTEKVKLTLNINPVEKDKIKFLRTILQDYIVLTR
jgi:hypothetical protein